MDGARPMLKRQPESICNSLDLCGSSSGGRRSTITKPILSLHGEVLSTDGEPGDVSAAVSSLFHKYASTESHQRESIDEIQAISLKRKNMRGEQTQTEHDLFMELIYDIQHELDVERLCFKILHNVAVLTNCDRSSLFLTCSDGGKEKLLVCKLFDLTSNSQYEEVCQAEDDTFIIPFGKGVLGHVAESKQFVKIDNAYQVWCDSDCSGSVLCHVVIIDFDKIVSMEIF